MTDRRTQRDIEKLIKTFNRLPKQLRRRSKKQLREAAKRVAMHARKEIRSGSKSGRVYSGSKPKQGFSYRGHRASAAGQYPARLTGDLARSVKWKAAKHGGNAIVFTTAPHAHLMEYGTANRTVKTFRRSAGKVEPRPFLRRALSEKQNEVLDAIRTALEQTLRGEN
ncbi:MAG: hypothetical protein Alpg2KO_00510 [Alphaproteobacteria bacterium]